MAVALAAVLFGYGWMTLKDRDRWVSRIEVLYARELRVMTLLTELGDELRSYPLSEDIEEMKREVQARAAILEATVWTRHEDITLSGHRVKIDPVATRVGARMFLRRDPGPGDTVVNVIHFDGNELFVYEHKFAEDSDGKLARFSLTFDAAQVRTAWASEELRH